MPVEITLTEAPVAYPNAMEVMNARVDAIIAGSAPEQIWFLEHEACYTAGTSAKASDLLQPRFPVYETGRGGEYTYHGPGQQVVYCMLDLKRRQTEPDLRAYVFDLEQIVIDTLWDLGIVGERRAGRVGVWVVRDDGREEKIAAIGVRVRKWVTSHGLSFNLNPDLSHYTGIVPCGIAEHGVTSIASLGLDPIAAREALEQRVRRYGAL